MIEKSYKSDEVQKEARAKLSELIKAYSDNPFFKVFRAWKRPLSEEMIGSIENNYTLLQFQKQNQC